MLRLSLTSGDLPAGDRMALLRDLYARSLIGCELEPLGGGELDIDIDSLLLDGCGTGRGVYSPMTAERSGALVETGADHVLIAVSNGRFGVSSGGGEVLTAGRGLFAVIPMDRDVTMTYFEPQVARSIWIRRGLLESIAPGIAFDRVRLEATGTPALRLLFAYGSALRENDALEPGLEALAVRQIAELGAAVLSTQPAAMGHARLARIAAVRRDMSRNFRDPTLTVARLAERHGISPRYLHMLFEREADTAASALQRLRLDDAHARLRDPRRRGELVATIAFDAGFADLSAFNRAFRRRFGATPSDVRAAAPCSGGPE